MTIPPFSPLGIATRSALRAEASAGWEGNIAAICFVVAVVVLGALTAVGMADLREKLNRLDDDLSRSR